MRPPAPTAALAKRAKFGEDARAAMGGVKMRLPVLVLAVLAAALTACGPNIQGLEGGERGIVAEVRDGDTLVLDSGLRVTLTGIEAPYGDAAYAAEARAALNELTMGRPARLAYGGLRRQPPPRRAGQDAEAAAPADDASATALAQVFVQSEGGRWIWVQHAMLRRGAAWARPRRDNLARADRLLAAEAEARAARTGLWALPDYRTRTVAQIEAETLPNASCFRGPYRIVEGVVREVAQLEARPAREGRRASSERVYLNFGEDYRTDFTIAIYGEDVAGWTGPPFASYEGKRVRARGHVVARNGPLMCADTPMQIEVLGAA